MKKLSTRLNRRGVVLMYHRVAPLDYDPRRLCVTPVHFEEHMVIIKKYGRSVQMGTMGRNLRHISIGAPEIVVTLDDGYADNYHHAKPILQKRDMAATFFIISGAVGSRDEFFWDGLERTVLAPLQLPEIFELSLNDKTFRWTLKPEGTCLLLDYAQSIDGVPEETSVLSRAQLYSALIHILGPLPAAERKEALNRIAWWAGQTLETRPDYLPMTSEELMSLAGCSLFEVGAHTVNHPQLANVPPDRQENEIAQSKQDLENRLNREITSFSYPHGSYSQDTLSLMDRCKFKAACTVNEAPVVRDADPYQLPRFAVLDWGGDQFEQKLRQWLA